MGEARDRGTIGYVILNALDRLYDMTVYEDHDEAAQDASWYNLFDQRDGPWRVVALVEELMAGDTEEKSYAANMDCGSVARTPGYWWVCHGEQKQWEVVADADTLHGRAVQGTRRWQRRIAKSRSRWTTRRRHCSSSARRNCGWSG